MSLFRLSNDQRKTERVTFLDSSGNPISYTANYDYDTESTSTQHPIDALTSVTRTYTAGGISDESYAYGYDGVGNITSNNGASASFNNLNQNTGFTYDARGNRKNDGNAYTWDALDHLTSVTAPDQSQRLEFTYDPQGRRVEKRVYVNFDVLGHWELASTRRYAWDGDAIVAEFDGGNQLLTTYTWGIGGLAGGLLAVTDHTPAGGPRTYTVISDATGSVVGLVDSATGQVAASYRYDPYGNLLGAGGPAAAVCNYRFAGGFADAETGLQYHLNRYYDAGSGRWLSRDPIAESGGENLSAYVSGDPVNRTDVSGLAPDAVGPHDVIGEREALIRYLMADGVPEKPTQAKFDLGIYYQKNRRSDGSIPATELVNLGRTLPIGTVIEVGCAPRDLAAYVTYGQSLAPKPAPQSGSKGLRGWGYYDEFGSHETFCYSCHLQTKGAQLKFSAANAGANNSWAVFVARDIAPNLIPIPYAALGEAVEATAQATRAIALIEREVTAGIRAERIALNLLESRAARNVSNFDAFLVREAGVRSANSANAIVAESAGALDTIPAGQRIILRPVEIQFPAKGLSPAERGLFASHLAEQEATLNRLSSTAKSDLEINLLNYRNIKAQVAESRQLARAFLPGDGQGLDAAHALDAVAGSYTYEFVGFRSPVQQRIGALWRTRTGQIAPGRVHRLVPVFQE